MNIDKSNGFSDVIQVGNVLTVTPDPSSSVLVCVEYADGSKVKTSVSSATTFGPYLVDMRMSAILASGSGASVVESVSQRSDLTNMVTATTNLTGVIDFSPDIVAATDEKARPIICIGGDHPYLQWWGTNGSNGMLKAYSDNNLPTYNAICWDSESNSSGNREASFNDINGNSGQFMSIAQGLELQAKGLEFVAHGTRHPNQWDLLNSGIRIDYLGVAATATVLINGDGVKATQIVLVGNGGAEDTTLTISSYSTLTALKAAIDALAGGGKWLCQIAQELEGSENPKFLWPISAARTVTGGTTPFNNRRFCISGGVKFQYTGSVYKYATVNIAAAGAIKIFMDGVRAGTYSPTTQTVSAMLSAITSAVVSTFGATGFTAVIMDNGTNVVFRESYMQGDELATYLTRATEDCAGRAINVTYGYPHRYIVRRQMENLNAKAVAAGFAIKNMAQAGTAMSSRLVSDLPYNEWRLDPASFATGIHDPYQMPASLDTPWHGVCTITNLRTLPEFKASIDAVCDSGPWAVDYLIHNVAPDGTTAYQFPTNAPAYYDMTEADFVAGLQYLGAKKAAGLVDVMSPEKFRIHRRKRQKPKNLVFNPRFINREQKGGAAVLGCTTSASGANGFAFPGYQCYLPSGAGNLSAASVSNGALTLTTNGAISTGFFALRQALWLERGKAYDIGFQVDATGLTAGSVQCIMRTQRLKPRGILPQSATPYIGGGSIYAGQMGIASLKFVQEAPQDWSPERVMSKAGNFNMVSSPSHIKINYDGVGLSGDINIAGATPTATTAKEIANAINAAIASDAAYVGKSQYHTAARAEDNRLIIEGPSRIASPKSTGIGIAGGTTNAQLSVVFGGSEIQSFGLPSGAEDSSHCLYWMEIFIATGTNGTVVISQPFASEVTTG